MRKTKKMMLVTLMATTAIAMLLMSRAFAAPATCPYSGLLAGTSAFPNTTASTSTCPTRNLLNQLLGSSGTSLPTSGSCPTAATLQQLLRNGTLTGCTSGTCPAGTCATGNCWNGICLTGNCKTGTCPTSKCTGSSCPKNTTTTTPASTPAPAPSTGNTTTTTPVTGNMSADESKMINLVNQDRANAGLKPLTFDSSLRAGALAHSQDMSTNNYFSHTSPTQGDFSARIRAAGVNYTSAGENIAQYGSVESAETGFMNSPGHRANILNTTFTRVGIGIVYNQSKGAYYITQWFAK